jgi:hypothetical protein
MRLPSHDKVALANRQARMSDKYAYKMKNLLSVDREAAGLVGHEALSLGGTHCVRD